MLHLNIVEGDVLTFTRRRDTQFPVSRPLAMCAISWTTPPLERISHCEYNINFFRINQISIKKKWDTFLSIIYIYFNTKYIWVPRFWSFRREGNQRLA